MDIIIYKSIFVGGNTHIFFDLNQNNTFPSIT